MGAFTMSIVHSLTGLFCNLRRVLVSASNQLYPHISPYDHASVPVGKPHHCIWTEQGTELLMKSLSASRKIYLTKQKQLHHTIRGNRMVSDDTFKQVLKYSI